MAATPPTVHTAADAPMDSRHTRGGDFFVATSGDFLMATGSRDCLPTEEASLKVRQEPPGDAATHYDPVIWAGVVPLLRTWGEPERDPRLRAGIPPDHVSRLVGQPMLERAAAAGAPARITFALAGVSWSPGRSSVTAHNASARD